jgi:hypothetical protein
MVVEARRRQGRPACGEVDVLVQEADPLVKRAAGSLPEPARAHDVRGVADARD